MSGEYLKQVITADGVQLVEMTQEEIDSLYPPAGNSEEELYAMFDKALEQHLDSVAQSDGWSNRINLIARAGYPNPWRDLAISFGIWMDDCNVRAVDLYNRVKLGQEAMPTVEGFLASLPGFTFPERS